MALLRQRKLDDAIRMLQDARAKGVVASRRSYSWLVTLLCRQRRFATAHNWYLNLAQEGGLRLDDIALAMLVQEAVRIGRKDEAWALLQVGEFCFFRVSVLEEMALRTFAWFLEADLHCFLHWHGK
jgi:hypothetical protein